jgi:hypothetical protein
MSQVQERGREGGMEEQRERQRARESKSERARERERESARELRAAPTLCTFSKGRKRRRKEKDLFTPPLFHLFVTVVCVFGSGVWFVGRWVEVVGWWADGGYMSKYIVCVCPHTHTHTHTHTLIHKCIHTYI